jgi:hypothetical protein
MSEELEEQSLYGGESALGIQLLEIQHRCRVNHNIKLSIIGIRQPC